jgi:hypothetical protein
LLLRISIFKSPQNEAGSCKNAISFATISSKVSGDTVCVVLSNDMPIRSGEILR